MRPSYISRFARAQRLSTPPSFSTERNRTAFRHLLSELYHLNSESAGKVLHILPRNTAGTRTARRCPFQCLAMKLIPRICHAVMGDITVHHVQKLVLAAAVKTKP